MIALLILAFLLSALGTFLAIKLVLSIDEADLTVSPEWRQQHAASEVRAVATIEHEYAVDGKVLLRHPDEETVRAVRTEIENLRGRGERD